MWISRCVRKFVHLRISHDDVKTENLGDHFYPWPKRSLSIKFGILWGCRYQWLSIQCWTHTIFGKKSFQDYFFHKNISALSGWALTHTNIYRCTRQIHWHTNTDTRPKYTTHAYKYTHKTETRKIYTLTQKASTWAHTPTWIHTKIHT